jgi:hypothetical protein
LVLVLFLLSFFGVFLINNERLDITGMVINPPQGVFGFNLEDLGCSLSLGDCVLVYPRINTYVSERRPNSAGADGLYLYVGNSMGKRYRSLIYFSSDDILNVMMIF